MGLAKISAIIAMSIFLAISTQVSASAQNGITRFAGKSRVETAIKISENLIPDSNKKDHIVLATANDFADAQSATPLAVRLGTSMLLTQPDSLHPKVTVELDRALNPNGTVWIIGGAKAISPEVEADIKTLGYQTRRLSGPTRVETAMSVNDINLEYSKTAGKPIEKAYVVEGPWYGVGLIAASHAAREGSVLLIGDTGHYWAQKNLPNAEIYVVGKGWSQSTNQNIIPIGDVRTMASRMPGDHPKAVAIASLQNFPDSLSGGVHAASTNKELFLASPRKDDLFNKVLGQAHDLSDITIYGGLKAVPQEVAQSLYKPDSTPPNSNTPPGQNTPPNGTPPADSQNPTLRPGNPAGSGCTPGRPKMVLPDGQWVGYVKSQDEKNIYLDLVCYDSTTKKVSNSVEIVRPVEKNVALKCHITGCPSDGDLAWLEIKESKATFITKL